MCLTLYTMISFRLDECNIISIKSVLVFKHVVIMSLDCG